MIRYIQLVAYNIQFWNQWLFHLFLNGSDFHSLSSIGMTVEANRLLAIYKASYAVPSTSTGIARNIENLQPSAKVKLDKNLGWIPNPRTEMNKFYDNVYKPFYSEHSGVYRHTKKDFKNAFHTDAQRQYDNEKNISKIGKQVEHIQSKKDPSQAGYILRENHVLKPHDSEAIRQNIIHIDDLQHSIYKIEKELNEHLKKTIHSLSR